MDEAIEKQWQELSEEVLIGMKAWQQQHPNATLGEIREAVNEQRARMISQVDWSPPLPGGEWAIVNNLSQGDNRIYSKRPEKTDDFPLRDDLSLPLWERIRAWCQYVSWYGPDWYGPDTFDFASLFENGELVLEKLTHDLRTGFAFPPATEEQLRQTEQMMGYPHPPLLRTLYLHVANGGFGPWEGLIGVPGGFANTLHARDPRYDNEIKEDLIKNHGEAFCRDSYPRLFDPIPFDLEQREKIADDPRLICLAEREWPAHFLNVCRGQEEEGFYVHAINGHVYLVGNAWNHEKTLTGEEATSLLHRQADSLEEWFERWLAGELQSRYYSDEPEPRERGRVVQLFADEFDPFLDA